MFEVLAAILSAIAIFGAGSTSAVFSYEPAVPEKLTEKE